MFKLCLVVLMAIIVLTNGQSKSFAYEPKTVDYEGLGGMLPSASYLKQSGINLDASTVMRIGELYANIESVFAGEAIPKVKILQKVTCTNIMPYFNEDL